MGYIEDYTRLVMLQKREVKMNTYCELSTEIMKCKNLKGKYTVKANGIEVKGLKMCDVGMITEVLEKFEIPHMVS